MTRFALILAVAVALSGAGFSSLFAKEKELKVHYRNGKFPAIYAIRDIPQGTIIRNDSFAVHPEESCRIPDRSAFPELAVGRKSKYGTAKGLIISEYDLEDLPPDRETSGVFLVKSVPKGTTIQEDLIKQNRSIHAGDLPARFLFSAKQAIGKVAATDLVEGKFLSESDLSGGKFQSESGMEYEAVTKQIAKEKRQAEIERKQAEKERSEP